MRPGDSDRYYLSGLAYHAADGIDHLLYQQLNAGVRRPDLYLFLQLDPAVAAARLGDRARDRWERGGIAARVPQCYQAALHLVETAENARIARLDAAAAPHDVLAEARSEPFVQRTSCSPQRFEFLFSGIRTLRPYARSGHLAGRFHCPPAANGETLARGPERLRGRWRGPDQRFPRLGSRDQKGT
jgi:hypothetical protein